MVAVSGGVDSVALLHMLTEKPDTKLIVAHFDHGIRSDSAEDRLLVQSLAQQYGLHFVYDEGALGSGSSEDLARVARYKFLHSVREASAANGIITAHHNDDLLETAIHNILRGTNWRGLISLRSRENIHRPLLHISKKDLIAYAKDQGLVWREDSTNADLRYRRNYIRHIILPKLSSDDRIKLLQYITTVRDRAKELDAHVINYLHIQPGVNILDRYSFVMLPHIIAREVLASWLRNNGIRVLDTSTIERLVNAAKTYHAGRKADISGGYTLLIDKNTLAIQRYER